MDIKAKVNEIVSKIKGDPELLKKFTSDPAGAVKGLVGADIPTDQLNKIIEGVKSKIGGGLLGKLGGLFGKKK